MGRIPRHLIAHLEWKPGDPDQANEHESVSNPICNASHAVAERLAVWQRQQTGVGEESLTDWMLFELSATIPTLRYVKFTHWDEARTTGADWEWWFQLRDAWVGFRVQAKRLKVGFDNYAGLAYANDHGLQIEKLREDARSNRLLAIYALYAPGDGGSTTLCQQRVPAVDCGVFLASASRLHANFIARGRAAVMDSAVLAHANPMPCLFCCPLVAGNTKAGWLKHITAYYAEELDAEDLGDGVSIGFHEQPPTYVRMIAASDLNGRTRNAPAQYGAPAIDGVAVFDLREA